LASQREQAESQRAAAEAALEREAHAWEKRLESQQEEQNRKTADYQAHISRLEGSLEKETAALAQARQAASELTRVASLASSHHASALKKLHDKAEQERSTLQAAKEKAAHEAQSARENSAEAFESGFQKGIEQAAQKAASEAGALWQEPEPSTGEGGSRYGSKPTEREKEDLPMSLGRLLSKHVEAVTGSDPMDEAITEYLGGFLHGALTTEETAVMCCNLQDMLFDFCPAYADVSKPITESFLASALAALQEHEERAASRDALRGKSIAVKNRQAFQAKKAAAEEQPAAGEGCDEAEVEEEEEPSTEAQVLAEFFPAIGIAVIEAQLRQDGGDIDAAAQALMRYDPALEHGSEGIRSQPSLTPEEWKSLREQIVERYDMTLHSKKLPNVISVHAYHNDYTEQKPQKQRWRDGRVVASRGETFIVEKAVEDPKTFVSIRVKHKGRQKGMDGTPPVKTGPRTK